jgi:hypothetical protein
MAGVSRSAASLSESVVRVEVGHVVSHGSMVSRAYLVEHCAGVVVDGGDRGLWLVSSPVALLPDPDGLRLWAEAEKGIPFEHGQPRLMKIVLRWRGEVTGELTGELKVPQVLSGPLGAAAVSLSVPASLRDRLLSDDGPAPVDLGQDIPLELGDEVCVAVSGAAGSLVRWGRVSSDPGFAGRPGGFALGLGLSAGEAGSPVFALGSGGTRFCGLAEPLDSHTSRLLSLRALAEPIASG